MPQCKYCGRKGMFLSIDKNGLCKYCQPIIIPVIQQHARIVIDSIKLAEEGKTYKTRVSRCNLIVEHSKALLEYEEKDIPTLTPLPSELIEHFTKYHDEIILEEANDILEKAAKKAQITTSPRTKETTYVSALLKIDEITPYLKNKRKILPIAEKLRSLIHDTKLNNFLEAAKKAEFKKQFKKAIDQYQEALYFVLNDEIPDKLQEDIINELKSKIQELSNLHNNN